MTFLERVGSKKVSGRTLHDVARVSGLSTATISKYLNGAKVKPENEKRIIQAIEECGYSVNFFAKVLKTNRSMTIGVLIPNLASTFYSSIVSEVERKLAMKGYTLFISGYDNNESQENAKFQTLVSRRVDAILVAPERLSAESFEMAQRNGIPVLCFDTLVEGNNCPAVITNNFDVCKSVMKRLILSDFHKIVVLLPNVIYFTTGERRRGCEEALKEHKAESRAEFLHTSGDALGAYECVKSSLRQLVRPDVVFALSSGTFLGALMAIEDTGLKIPDDLAFIGYDNRMISRVHTPNISLVYQPIQEIADNICIGLERLLIGEMCESTVVASQVFYTESIDRPSR